LRSLFLSHSSLIRLIITYSRSYIYVACCQVDRVRQSSNGIWSVSQQSYVKDPRAPSKQANKMCGRRSSDPRDFPSPRLSSRHARAAPRHALVEKNGSSGLLQDQIAALLFRHNFSLIESASSRIIKHSNLSELDSSFSHLSTLGLRLGFLSDESNPY
jgi:hypothetical protein